MARAPSTPNLLYQVLAEKSAGPPFDRKAKVQLRPRWPEPWLCRSPTAPDEFEDLAAQCIVSCVELVDHRKVIVQFHARETRACAVPFA